MISVFGSKVGKEELEEIRTSIENQWIGIGPKTKLFEKEFAKRLNLNDFAMLDSGSNSLYLAIKLLDLPEGSEIILPTFTWISCATAIVLNRCKPVFADIDIKTQNITHDSIASVLTDKARAILVVHYAGKPVKMDKIKEFGLPIIEDAAHAVDSMIGQKYCGSIGDIGIYSFDGVKNLAIGEAGGITSNDELMEKAMSLRYCGIKKSGFEASGYKKRWWEYDVVDYFPKLIPDDISASIGLAQLRKLDKLQKYRKYIWDIYQDEFEGVSWINTPKDAEENERHSYFTYFISLNNDKRDDLANYLYEKDIYTTLRYQPLHMIPIYGSTDVKLENSELLNETGLNIPLHPNICESDIEYIINTIKKFGKQNNL
jgi:aminotransferase